MNKLKIEPPEGVKRVCPHWEDLALQYLEDASLDTISMHHVEGQGVTPVDRLKVGMHLEIQSDNNTDFFWPASITCNKGGLLTLEYLPHNTEGAGRLKETFFYTSERLFPWKHGQNNGRNYVHPEKFEPQNSILDTVSSPSPAPSDVIEPVKLENHEFKNGHLLEVVVPEENKVYLGKVLDASNPKYFMVRLLGREEPKIVICHKGTPTIAPVGWSRGFHGYHDSVDKSLKAEDLPKLEAKASWFTFKEKAVDLGFQTGQKLEVLHHGQLRCATISDIKDHMLRITLDSDSEATRAVILMPANSTNLFHLGWSQTNQMRSLVPKSIAIKTEEIKTAVQEEQEEEPKKEEPKKDSKSGSWSPQIYFNYKCYSASFLSRARLASLPKSVGPGPVQLVMSKVLSLVIGSSYKSASILRRLECKDDQARLGFVLERLKGKSRVLDLKADIEIPTRTDLLEDYLKEVCTKLSACPNLVSTKIYDEACPSNCMRRSSRVPDNEDLVLPARGRKRRKKRMVLPGETEAKPEDGSSSSEESNSNPGSNAHSR